MVSDKKKAEAELALTRFKRRREKAVAALERVRELSQSNPKGWEIQIQFGEWIIEKFDFQILQSQALLEGRELTPEEEAWGERLFG